MNLTLPQAGRNVLITGANVGIGRVTAITLAKQGARVFIAGRSEEKIRPVVQEICSATGWPDAAMWIPLELSDLASVKNCAEQFLKLGLPLHMLINNAGLAGAKGQTAQGFELAFGVNHLGHFLLTHLLLDRIKASAPARIITVASRAHRMVRGGIAWDALQKPSHSLPGVKAYGLSNLRHILFTAELAPTLPATPIPPYSLHHPAAPARRAGMGRVGRGGVAGGGECRGGRRS